MLWNPLQSYETRLQRPLLIMWNALDFIWATVLCFQMSFLWMATLIASSFGAFFERKNWANSFLISFFSVSLHLIIVPLARRTVVAFEDKERSGSSCGSTSLSLVTRVCRPFFDKCFEEVFFFGTYFEDERRGSSSDSTSLLLVTLNCRDFFDTCFEINVRYCRFCL